MLRSADGHDPEELLAEMRDRLVDAWGEAIDRIILYGSPAKGEGRPESDFDLLVVYRSGRLLHRVDGTGR